MRPEDNIGWLHIGTPENRRYTLIDHGRLEQVISELAAPRSQNPSMCAFLGTGTKDSCLRQLYPDNNIRRHGSEASIRLRYDIRSLKTPRPVLFVDGNPLLNPKVDSSHANNVVQRPVAWETTDGGAFLRVIWARLIFLFSDVVCIFAHDFPHLSCVAEFLLVCLSLQSASSLPTAIRPRVIVVLEVSNVDGNEDITDIEEFYSKLNGSEYGPASECFSAVHMIRLEDNRLSEEARYGRLRALIAGQMDDMCALRRDYRATVSAFHLLPLFQAALHHFVEDVHHQFDFVRATREGNTIMPSLSTYLAHYQDLGYKAGLQFADIAASIASALVMDHYVPDMLVLEPRNVYQTLYRSAVLHSLRNSTWHSESGHLKEPIAMIEAFVVEYVDQLEHTGRTSAQLRLGHLKVWSGRLCSVKSNIICLICLIRPAQHRFECGHTICDNCAHVVGSPMIQYEYRFTISSCPCCLYRRPLVIDILPPTMNPTILAIDGGGVRGVIPLEFLVLLQESLGHCPLQDLVDLGVGTSSGGLSILGLFTMQWSARRCAEVFDHMASEIFREKRSSPLSRLSHALFGSGSVFGTVHKWLLWLLHDSCYDGLVFDKALKRVYGTGRRIFDSLHPLQTDKFCSTHSRTKVGVVATSIAKETWSFVFGNFNVAETVRSDCGYEIVRPVDTQSEPFVWEAARATAAAPFFFPPTDIPGIGSFQDGGLRDNLAADIARRLSRQIWPTKKNPARLLSMGTGLTERSSEKSPHFRHVLRDSFLRRGFDAWMSSMETETKWLDMMGQISADTQEDYLRLNIPLQNVPSAIDSIGAMEEYRNLVALYPGSARMAREAATALLVSRFFFVLDCVPGERCSPIWCRGLIRCKGRAKQIVDALDQLHPQGLEYRSDSGLIGPFNGVSELCSTCSRYGKPIAFLADHLDTVINIYVKSKATKQRWRLSGFPGSMTSFAAAQHLQAPFGSPNHGQPGTVICHNCDRSQVLGRKRFSTESRGDQFKKVRLA